MVLGESEKRDGLIPPAYRYLVAIEVAPMTMRLANMLATSSTKLPKDFARRYIVVKADACSRIQSSEERERQVRIVCKLIAALERNQVISLPALHLELQAFALKHSQCPEAVLLYQRLTSLR